VRKSLAVVAAAACLLAPLAAQAGDGGVNECRWLRRQITHYSRMHEQAKELEHELWIQRFGNHLQMLRTRQEDRCPQDVPPDNTARALMHLMRIAGQAALSYFTMGAL
jgi:hypothetical protein